MTKTKRVREISAASCTKTIIKEENDYNVEHNKKKKKSTLFLNDSVARLISVHQFT